MCNIAPPRQCLCYARCVLLGLGGRGNELVVHAAPCFDFGFGGAKRILLTGALLLCLRKQFAKLFGCEVHVCHLLPPVLWLSALLLTVSNLIVSVVLSSASLAYVRACHFGVRARLPKAWVLLFHG